MFSVMISGNLTQDLRPGHNGKHGKFLSIRLAATTYKWNRATQSNVQIATYASGLIDEKKISGIKDRLVKGRYVVVASNDCLVETYTSNKGEVRAELNLKYMTLVEISSGEAKMKQKTTSYQSQEDDSGLVAPGYEMDTRTQQSFNLWKGNQAKSRQHKAVRADVLIK